MAYTTSGGTKKKVCYYYDGMGHPEFLNEDHLAGLTLAVQLVWLAGAAGEYMGFNTCQLASKPNDIY